MNAVILAAGMGRRLGILGEAGPKCLLPVNGKSALGRMIATIERSRAVGKIVVVGGHGYERLASAVPHSVTLLRNDAFETSNSIVSLALALSHLEADDLVFFNADIVYGENLLIRFLCHPQKTSCLIDETADPVAGDYYARIRDGLVMELSPDLDPAKAHGLDAQAYRVAGDRIPEARRIVTEFVERGETGRYAGNVMIPLLDSTPVHPVFTNGEYWGEFDTPETYERLQRDVERLEAMAPSVQAYGLGVNPAAGREPSGGQKGMTGRTFAFPAILIRVANCIRERRLPSKADRVIDLAKSFFVYPGRSWKYAKPLITRRMSRKAFNLQLYGAELLRTLIEEAEALQIRPFLVWGTLLGCVRENAFIMNDEDVDVGLMSEEFESVPELERRMALRGCTVRRQDEDKISFFHPTVPGLAIDVDRFYKDEDCLWTKTDSSEDEYTYSCYFPRNTFDELTRIRFEGVDVHIPAHPEVFLRQVYGKWEIPEAKRDVRRGPLNIYLRKKKSSPGSAEEVAI